MARKLTKDEAAEATLNLLQGAAEKQGKKPDRNAPVFSDAQLKSVALLAAQLLAVEAELEVMAAAWDKAKARSQRLAEVDLPEALKEIGLESVTLKTGEVVSVREEVFCSVSEENKPKAFAWLEKNDAAGLIKTEVRVAFQRGEIERARKLLATLSKNKGAEVALLESVHAGTLKAFIKERLAAKKRVPMELFGARAVSRASVKAKR